MLSYLTLSIIIVIPSLAAVELPLYPHRLHLVHLGDALAQVLGELAAVVFIARVERR